MTVNDFRVFLLFEKMQAAISTEIREMLGEEPYDASMFAEAEHQRRAAAMVEMAAHADECPDVRHIKWCQTHLDDGWRWGAEYDPYLKLHPELCAWSALPQTVKSKRAIMAIVAKYAAKVDELYVPRDDR